MSRKLALALALALGLVVAFVADRATAEGGGPIGAVDVQGAIMRTEDGMRAQATLKKFFDSRQRQLDARQDELNRKRRDIERQSRVLSREALARRMEQWQLEMVELQTTFVDYNKELSTKQDQLTAPIFQRIVAISDRLAKQQGYAMIIDRQAAPYVRADLDLTERVVQMYNAGEWGDGGPPKAD